jgi:hypothetical protein
MVPGFVCPASFIVMTAMSVTVIVIAVLSAAGEETLVLDTLARSWSFGAVPSLMV